MVKSVAIVGSRNYSNKHAVEKVVKSLPRGTIVRSGGARGVDTDAVNFAKECGLGVDVIPAQWSKYGKSAGMLRNPDIVLPSDRVVAFWDERSKGTADSISLALRNSIPVTVYNTYGVNYSPVDLDHIKGKNYAFDGMKVRIYLSSDSAAYSMSHMAVVWMALDGDPLDGEFLKCYSEASFLASGAISSGTMNASAPYLYTFPSDHTPRKLLYIIGRDSVNGSFENAWMDSAKMVMQSLDFSIGSVSFNMMHPRLASSIEWGIQTFAHLLVSGDKMYPSMVIHNVNTQVLT